MTCPCWREAGVSGKLLGVTLPPARLVNGRFPVRINRWTQQIDEIVKLVARSLVFPQAFVESPSDGVEFGLRVE